MAKLAVYLATAWMRGRIGAASAKEEIVVAGRLQLMTHLCVLYMSANIFPAINAIIVIVPLSFLPALARIMTLLMRIRVIFKCFTELMKSAPVSQDIDLVHRAMPTLRRVMLGVEGLRRLPLQGGV